MSELSNSPFFSVIITTRAESDLREAWLIEAISSVFIQDFKDYELIVVDDSGKKKLRNRLEIFQKEIILVENAKNIGLQKSFNEGLYHASGKWIVRLDDDDKFLPHTLKKLYDFISTNKDEDLAFVYSDIILMHNNQIYEYPDWDGTLLGLEKIGHVQAIRRDALLKIGGWRVDIDYSADTDCVIRLVEAGYNIKHIPVPLYLNRYHQAQYTVQYAKEKDPLKAKNKIFEDAIKRMPEKWKSDFILEEIKQWRMSFSEFLKIKKFMKGNGFQIGCSNRLSNIICLDFKKPCHFEIKDSLPFKGNFFDFVLYTSKDILLIKQVIDCLKDNGYLIFLLESAELNPENFLNLMKELIEKYPLELVQYNTIRNSRRFECILRKSSC